MSFENLTPEEEPRFPSLEEIKAQIERLSGQENPEVIRSLEDERGVYLHEVVIVDDKGNASLFSYRRSGNYQETKAATTVIDVAYFIGSVDVLEEIHYPITIRILVNGLTLNRFQLRPGL